MKSVWCPPFYSALIVKFVTLQRTEQNPDLEAVFCPTLHVVRSDKTQLVPYSPNMSYHTPAYLVNNIIMACNSTTPFSLKGNDILKQTFEINYIS